MLLKKSPNISEIFSVSLTAQTKSLKNMLINAWRKFSGPNHAAKHCDLLKSSVGIGFKTSNVTKGIRWIPGLGRVIGGACLRCGSLWVTL